MSAWIELLSVEGSTGKLKEAFEEAKTPSGTVDNVMRVHSHRPHTMLGHLSLYRSVLHNSENDATDNPLFEASSRNTSPPFRAVIDRLSHNRPTKVDVPDPGSPLIVI